jgi:carbonic anhydrase
MKNNQLRPLLIFVVLTITLSSLGAPWTADSRLMTAAPVTECLPDNKPANAETALKCLEEGNKSWQTTMARRDWHRERGRTSSSQHPSAIVIACMDSRVPPELIFDQGLGKIFVVRVAGPVMNEDELASLEYALVNLKVKLALVLGHTDCGAVKGAVDRASGTYLPELLDKIEPAIRFVSDEFNGGRRITSADKRSLSRVSLANARIMQTRILEKSALRQPGVRVTWGLYYVDSGEVAIEPRDARP